MFNARTILLAHRFRLAVVCAMMPAALWTAAPFACSCGVGKCPALNASLMGSGFSAASRGSAGESSARGCCCDCCGHEISHHLSHTRVVRRNPLPDKYDCPLISRDPVVVAPAPTSDGFAASRHHVVAVFMPNARSVNVLAAAVRPGDRFETGPPHDFAARSERLLI